MGFGVIIAAVIFVSLLAVATYLVAVSAIYTMDSLSGALDRASEFNSERIMTSVRIANVSILTNNTISVMLNNTGSTKIHNLRHMDVFIHYTANETDEKLTERLRYNSGGISELQYDEWTCLNITPDAVNPGIFDPDECMEILLKVQDINRSTGGWIKVVTPNGISSFKYF